MMKKHLRYALYALSIAVVAACSGEDRSGEIPYAPTVRTLSTVVKDSACTFSGIVDSSPNSDVTRCGFSYGLTGAAGTTILSADTPPSFSAKADSLEAGTYYGVAYATNGIGTSYGDTLYFTIVK